MANGATASYIILALVVIIAIVVIAVLVNKKPKPPTPASVIPLIPNIPARIIPKPTPASLIPLIPHIPAHIIPKPKPPKPPTPPTPASLIPLIPHIPARVTVTCDIDDDGKVGYGVAYGKPAAYTITTSKAAVANSSRYIQISEEGNAGCLLSKCAGTYKVSDSTSKMYCIPGDESSNCTVTTSNQFPGDTHDITDTHAAWTTQYQYPGDTKYCRFSQCADGYNLSGNTCKQQTIPCSPTTPPEHSNNKTVCKDGQWIVSGCDDGPVITYEPTKDGHACKASGCTNKYGVLSSNCAVSESDSDAIKYYLFESDTDDTYIKYANQSGKVTLSSDTYSLIMDKGSGDYPAPWSGCGNQANLPDYARGDKGTCVGTVEHMAARHWRPDQTPTESDLPLGGCKVCAPINCPPGTMPGDDPSKCASWPSGCASYIHTSSTGTIDTELKACAAESDNVPPAGYAYDAITKTSYPIVLQYFYLHTGGLVGMGINLTVWSWDSNCKNIYNSGDIGSKSKKLKVPVAVGGFVTLQGEYKPAFKARKRRYRNYTYKTIVSKIAAADPPLTYTVNSTVVDYTVMINELSDKILGRPGDALPTGCQQVPPSQ